MTVTATVIVTVTVTVTLNVCRLSKLMALEYDHSHGMLIAGRYVTAFET